MSDFKSEIFGKYILLDKLATGGMAQVYRAKITGIEGFEKLVAIKMILPHLAKETELVSSFIDEAKLAALLNHQNTVQIHDFGSIGDSYFICMEYLSGKDLRALRKRASDTGHPLTLEYALYITSRICAGLDYAHTLKNLHGARLNLIHRDISPQNIFLTYGGAVKILDFGIAKAASQSTMTQCGMIKGKVSYMSPEQASGQDIDQRSDIYSTGILLYEMVTGMRMFSGDGTIQILERVRKSEYRPAQSLVSGLPVKVSAIIDRALAREREERYQSCGDMLADIEECMSGLSMRPTAHGLSQCMYDFFKEEIGEEERTVRRLMAINPDPANTVDNTPVEAAGAAGQTGSAELEKKKGKRTALIAGGIGIVVIICVLLLALWPKAKPVPEVKETIPVKTASPTGVLQKEASAKGKAKELVHEAGGYVHSKPEKAKGLFAEAIALDPVNMEAHFQLGLIYIHGKDYARSIEALKKVTEIDSRFPDGHFNLGYAYAMKKNYRKAEESYKRTVDLAPPYLDEALFNLAMVQNKQGKKKESRENLQKALRVNPDNKMAKSYLKKLK